MSAGSHGRMKPGGDPPPTALAARQDIFPKGTFLRLRKSLIVSGDNACRGGRKAGARKATRQHPFRDWDTDETPAVRRSRKILREQSPSCQI